MLFGIQFPSLRFLPARSIRASRTARLVLLATIGILASALAGAQRREFSATYSVSHVAEAETGIELTLTLTMHNFSGRNVENCGIVLNTSGPLPEPIGNFDLVKLLPSYRQITVRHRFTVPKAEYARWQQGVAPALEMLLPEGDGGARVEAIHVLRDSPMPVDPAE